MDKKSKIELGITAVLILVLLFAVTNAGKRGRGVRPEAGSAPKRPAQEKVLREVTEDEGLFKRLEQEAKDLKLKRDPFVPRSVISAEISPSGLHLSGIVWDKESPKAIINEIIVGIGDRVSGNIIIDIKQDRVILSDGTRYFEIRLGR